MVESINEYFPKWIKTTNPQGGMFIWATLPQEIDIMEIYNKALKEDVAFVPGTPFFGDNNGFPAMRLSYSYSNEEKIREGIKRLSRVLNQYT